MDGGRSRRRHRIGRTAALVSSWRSRWPAAQARARVSGPHPGRLRRPSVPSRRRALRSRRRRPQHRLRPVRPRRRRPRPARRPRPPSAAAGPPGGPGLRPRHGAGEASDRLLRLRAAHVAGVRARRNDRPRRSQRLEDDASLDRRQLDRSHPPTATVGGPGSGCLADRPGPALVGPMRDVTEVTATDCPFGSHLEGYVIVTGHFDDPVATKCKSVAFSPELDQGRPSRRWSLGAGPSRARRRAERRASVAVRRVVEDRLGLGRPVGGQADGQVRVGQGQDGSPPAARRSRRCRWPRSRPGCRGASGRSTGASRGRRGAGSGSARR